jgi:hypothetical protein
MAAAPFTWQLEVDMPSCVACWSCLQPGELCWYSVSGHNNEGVLCSLKAESRHRWPRSGYICCTHNKVVHIIGLAARWAGLALMQHTG